MLEIVKDQLTEFIHKLIETEVELGFNFIIQELFPKVLEGIVSRVTIQVEGVENVPVEKICHYNMCVVGLETSRTTKYT